MLKGAVETFGSGVIRQCFLVNTYRIRDITNEGRLHSFSAREHLAKAQEMHSRQAHRHRMGRTMRFEEDAHQH